MKLNLVTSVNGWDSCSLWFNVLAKQFNMQKKVNMFKSVVETYQVSDITRVHYLNAKDERSLGGTVAGAAVGNLLLGGVGTIAGALHGGKKQLLRIGIEFNNGDKIVFDCKAKDPVIKKFIKYVEKKNLTNALDF